MEVRGIIGLLALAAVISSAWGSERSWTFGGCRMDVCRYTAFGDQVLLRRADGEQLWKVGTKEAVCRGEDYDDPFTSASCEVNEKALYVLCSTHRPAVAVPSGPGLDGFRLLPGGTISDAGEPLHRTYWYICHGVNKPDLGKETRALARNLGYRVCTKPDDFSDDCRGIQGPRRLESGEELLDLGSTQILSTTKAYVDATSTAGKYKLEIFKKTKEWAIVSVIPVPEGSYEGAGVVLEKVDNKWVVRDMGTDLSEYDSKFE